MFVPFRLFDFCRIFILSLHLKRLHNTARGLLPLFVLFCMPNIRYARSISKGILKPSFSRNSCCCFSLKSSHVSPRVSRISSSPSHFFLTYPLDLLASARHNPDQSDSHIFLKFDVRYLLIYFQHCSLFFTVDSLWVLCSFSNVISLF